MLKSSVETWETAEFDDNFMGFITWRDPFHITHIHIRYYTIANIKLLIII